MATAGDADATMPDTSTQPHITFNIKSGADQKFTLTISEAATVLDLKTKLSTAEYADVPAERQRLIFSGRVLKDPDALSAYKIKDGNTLHLVKSAASNQQRNPASQNSSDTASSAGVPQNLATGTGNDPLAGLTGARYAGFAQMPGAGMFGPDGGMGQAPPNGDEMLRMLENPMFASQMNEAMNNPDAIRMLQQHPMIRDNPGMREMLNNPEFRRMMVDPNFIRFSMRQAANSSMFGGGAQNSMPAPGATDTTPPQHRAATNQTNDPQAPPNPFQLFNQQHAGAPNPFAALFGGGSTPQASSNTAGSTPNQTNPTGNTQGQDSSQPPSMDPFGLFGGGGGGEQSPIAAMTRQMMQNPEMMRSLMQSMNPQGAAPGSGSGEGGAGAAFNPFSFLGGAAGSGFGQPAAPPDTRPPEEQYAEQLRQLNDMGFYEFDANVRALRRSGGSVQGAVEALLSGV